MNGVEHREVEHPMELDHPSETTIVNESISLLELHQKTNYYANSACYGISTDIYQFDYDPDSCWNKGHIFNGSYLEDLSFDGMVQASDASNKREAEFFVHETVQQDAKEKMEISLRLKHDGIMRPFLVGYNTQTSQVISAFRMPQLALTLDDWLLAAKNGKGSSSSSIPPEVQQLLGTAYEAIVTIWQRGYTSDSLDNPRSYHMIGDKIKIDLLCIRVKTRDENDEMLIRKAFGKMILEHIYPVWKDNELQDFVDLVKEPNASVLDILEAPVLLLPESRELMYHTFDNAAPGDDAKRWLEEHAKPQVGWKVTAKNADPILETIIKHQEECGADFSTFKGAMHFASVVTAHYPQHFRNSAEAESGEKLQGRVDALLKKVLPGLLTKRYNSKYQPVLPAHQAPQAQDDLAAHQAPQPEDL